MADFKIKVESTNDGSGLKEAQKEVQDLKAEVKSLGDAYRAAGGGMAGLGAAGAKAKEMYEQGGGGVKGLFSVLAGGGAKAAAGIGAVTAAAVAGKKALQEFAAEEEGIRQLQAAMAANGFATKENNDKYQELAATLQDLTGKADSEWIDVMRRLTQFGATPQDIERHITAVKNLAGIMGGDLSGAATLVSRAMEGSFQMFSRLGIQIDETGSKSEKLDLLYQQLAQKGSGQLEASAQSLSGTFQKFGNNVSDAFEAIGQRIANLGVVQNVLYGLGTTIGWFAKLVGSAVPLAEGMGNALKKAGTGAAEAERHNQQYNESLKETETRAQAVAAALNQQVESQRQIRQLEDEQADAQMAMDIAVVDRLEKTGAIAPEQAIQTRSAIRSRYAGETHRREQEGRDQEIAHRQAKIDAARVQIEEHTTEADTRERDVVSDDDFNRRRGALHQKLEKEVQHWKRNLEAFGVDPTGYSNPELGVKAMPRWGREIGHIAGMISKRQWAAEAERDSQMATFDEKNSPIISGARERATGARQRADEMIANKGPEIGSLAAEIERIQADRASADNRFRTTTKTAAITAGTEAYSANPAVNTRAVEAQVLQASKAFQGKMDNLGAAIVQRFESDTQAISDLTRRLHLLEQQAKHRRN